MAGVWHGSHKIPVLLLLWGISLLELLYCSKVGRHVRCEGNISTLSGHSIYSECICFELLPVYSGVGTSCGLGGPRCIRRGGQNTVNQ